MWSMLVRQAGRSITRAQQHLPNRRWLSNALDGARHTLRSLMQRQSNELCTAYGWVKAVHKLKHKMFLRLQDGSGVTLQVVIHNQNDQHDLPSRGSAVACSGRLVRSTGHQQSLELACEQLEVIGPNDHNYGMLSASDARQHFHNDQQVDVRHLRQLVHLRPRHRYFSSILRLRSELQNALAIYMKQEEFTHCSVPLITTNDAEGGGQTFGLTPEGYFGRTVKLSVSGQLHLEALAASLGRVYTLSPVFRAERSMSPRHLSEFLMLEVEEAFLFNLTSLLDRVESLIKFVLYYLQSNCDQDLSYLRKLNDNYQGWQAVSDHRYARIDYEQALEMLAGEEKFAHLRSWRETNNSPWPSINAEMERRLVELSGGVPVFLTNFPSEQKPFYMTRSEDGQKAMCFDLLMPVGGEVAGGSLRQSNVDQLQLAMQQQNVPLEPLAWYVDLRRFGHAPTGGFGLGFDRLLQTITGVANIKDVVTFPRWPQHCYL